jgi:23S rRNA G2445 N2-methylase RlmL
VREVNALVDLLAGEDEAVAKLAARAIGRVGRAAFEPLQARLKEASPPLRAHIVRALGRLVDEPRALDAVLAALADADPKSRRNAAIALGHVGPEEVEKRGLEEILLRTWNSDPRPEMRRTLAATLGKIGSGRSLPLLRESARAEDPELARIAQRSSLMVERTASRGERGRIDGGRKAATPVDVVAFSRAGLEDLLADELARIAGVSEVRVTGRGCVRTRLVGAMNDLFAARTMLSFRFPLANPGTSPDAQAPVERLALAVTSAAARAILSTWTVGAVRYRLAWEDGSHKRAATWDAASAIRRRAPEFVNDPTTSIWELVVSLHGGQDQGGGDLSGVALVPRALEDPRFAWRVRDVPAASHPTVAAALARVAGARADDVVWDPFVGSGAELVERSLLGPYRALFGSDSDPHALSIARENLASASIHATLERRDALSAAPDGVTLIITNPPMGRRAARAPGTDEMLDRFVTACAGALSPGGRLVWLAPWPQRSRAAGLAAGLSLDWTSTIDMGGFEAEMQRWVKR